MLAEDVYLLKALKVKDDALANGLQLDRNICHVRCS